MATISEAMAVAVQYHQAGRLQEAEQIYRQVLLVDPNHADALHLLGLIAHHAGQHGAAIECIARAISADGRHGGYYNSLGVACLALGRVDEAIRAFQRAIQLAPGYAEAHHNLGNAWKRLGKADEAAACYRRALQARPDLVAAYNNQGVACFEQGNLEGAIACYQRALELKPDCAEVHNNLGNAWKERGNLEEAIACYRRAIALKPDFAEAHNNLGNAWKERGNLDEAIACYRRAIALKPDFAEAHNNLGYAWREQGKLDEAVGCFERAIALKPDFPDAYNNLGIVQEKQGKLDAAVAFLSHAIRANPKFAEAYHNLGAVRKEQGDLGEALACHQQAIELKPGYAEAYQGMAIALNEQGKIDDSIACYRRALELKPDFVEAYSNLGAALTRQGKLGEAIKCFRRALELKPDFYHAHNNLGNAWKDQGRLDEAIACYQRAMAWKPDFSGAHSNLLRALQYRPGVTLAELWAAHREFDHRHAAPLRREWRAHENSRDPQRRLCLGFVSADFCRHPVGYFLIRALENLDRRECQVVCYSDRLAPDDMTARFQAAADVWRRTAALSDDRLAEQIRADRIDILFDLAGHTAGNRLLVFARKPAPIQITWAGDVGTTGLAAMDYLLADRYEVPPQAEPYYAERVLRMPHAYVSFDPPGDAPEVGPLPALAGTEIPSVPDGPAIRAGGQVTLASFNNPAKITPQVVACWAKILRRLPQARLLLVYRALDDPGAQNHFHALFAEQGIAAQRIDLRGWLPHAELLALYNQVDLALDTFPYNGGLTTCEALWMGVPVVTFPGETFAGRHSLSHLSNAGVTETIAGNLDQYVDLAVKLAEDLPRLAALRAGLRDRVARSPLCDGPRFARDLMDLLRRVWREWAGA